MSRQYDECMNGKFDIYGETYSFIEPTNCYELVKACEVRDIIENYYGSLMHDDESKEAWLDILQEQEGYINTYLERLGEFDNTMLVGNINYLAKKCGMKIGDLEAALGVSAGYISRTAKQDSKKKMSIDLVWKIARFFSVDIKALLEKDLSIPERGIPLLKRFISKLLHKTVNGEIQWRTDGGCMMELNEKYVKMGLVADNENGVDPAFYFPNNLNPDLTWVLTSDIYAYENFDNGKDLVIVPFKCVEHGKDGIYDFLLVWKEKGVDKWERVFCTHDDILSHLAEYAGRLVKQIVDLEFEPNITAKHRSIIAGFLKEEN